MNGPRLLESLASAAKNAGLVFVGTTDIEISVDYRRYCDWLDAGNNADMEYLSRHRALRATPNNLLDGARSAIVLGFNYGLGDRLKELRSSATPWISQYARFRDYHRHLKKSCEKFLAELNSNHFFSAGTYRICVDSAPLLERALAAKTKSGFIGKNTTFIHDKKGSYLLLAVVLTTLELTSIEDAQEKENSNKCGTCRRCQVHCPTQALTSDYVLDARKCISYWTIEHRGLIPEEWWPFLRWYVFGCDICQLVCPKNREIKNNENHVETPNGSLLRLGAMIDLAELAVMNEEKFLNHFAGTPIMRAKRSGMVRNALIGMYVTGDARIQTVIDQLKHETDSTIAGTRLQILNAFSRAKVR